MSVLPPNLFTRKTRDASVTIVCVVTYLEYERWITLITLGWAFRRTGNDRAALQLSDKDASFSDTLLRRKLSFPVIPVQP